MELQVGMSGISDRSASGTASSAAVRVSRSGVGGNDCDDLGAVPDSALGAEPVTLDDAAVQMAGIHTFRR